MTPSPLDTVGQVLLDDCWLPQTKVCKYLGISRETLRLRMAAGRCLPHHIDPQTGRKFWRKRRLDAELEHEALADFSARSGQSSRNTREKRREKSHV